MRYLSLITLFLFVLLFASSHVSAKNYYVSVQGNDGHSGSAEQPYKTIAKASAVAVAGDVIYIYGGIYHETINALRSGTSSKPITYKAVLGEDVIIKGTRNVDNWQETEISGMYVADVTLGLGDYNHVFINGKAMTLARWPNDKDNDPFTIDAIVQEDGDLSMVQHQSIPDIDWTGAVLWYLGKHGGCSLREPVTGFDAATHQIKFATMPESWLYSNHNPTMGGRFYLQNALGALDVPNEWYYDKTNKKLYIIAPDMLDPNNAVVEYRQNREAINTKGKNYIVFDGINVFGGQVRLEGSYNFFRNGQVLHGDYGMGNKRGSNTSIASIANKGKYNKIENSLIEWGSANGINCEWTSSNLTVQNCIIRYFDIIGNHDAALRISGTGSKVFSNTISHSGRDVIKHSGQKQEYAYNDVSKGSLINVDAGLIYTAGNNGDGNQIHHNWFHDSYGPDFDPSGKACAIYFDNSTKRYTVHHNVIWNIEWTGVQMNWDDWYLYIYNNTFWNTGGATGAWHKEGTSFKDVVFGNNYSSKGYWDCTDTFTNIVNAVNPFENISERNFAPHEGSFLIDAGTAVSGITTNVDDGKPDLGAYEYGKEYWVPGADWTPRKISWLTEPEDGKERPFHTKPIRIPSSIEAENYNLGGEGIAYHDVDGENVGMAFRQINGVDIAQKETIYEVISFEETEWLNYFISIHDTTKLVFRANIKTESGCTFHLEAGGIPLGDPILLEAGNVDGINVKHVFDLDSGMHNFTLKVDQGSMVFDKFKIENYFSPGISLDQIPDSLFISEIYTFPIAYSTGEEGYIKLSMYNEQAQLIGSDTVHLKPGTGVEELNLDVNNQPKEKEMCSLGAALFFHNELESVAMVENHYPMVLQQFVSNNDFELGNLLGWSTYRAEIETGESIISGNYTGRIHSQGRIFQNIRVQANTHYLLKIKCRVKSEGNVGNLIFDSSENEYGASFSNTEVQTISLRFKSDSVKTLIKFTVEAEKGATIWVDDMELVMDLSSGIKTAQTSIAVYPNPTSDWLNLSLKSFPQSLSFYDMNGRLVRMDFPLNNRINVQDLKSGIYVGSVKMINGEVYRFRFVKK